MSKRRHVVERHLAVRKLFFALLVTLLKEVTNEMAFTSLSITRRSGGLPFAFISLMKSLPDNELKNRLSYVMSQLLFVASESPSLNHDTRFDLAQVHDLNLIRYV